MLLLLLLLISCIVMLLLVVLKAEGDNVDGGGQDLLAKPAFIDEIGGKTRRSLLILLFALLLFSMF